jgi:anti-sigma regulatory factor (Ser/Thr protein kinase)
VVPARADSLTEAVDHRVLFYADAPSLVEVVGTFLLGALRADRAAVVLATSRHRREIEEWLSLSGIDLAGSARRGNYQAVDVEEVLARLACEDHDVDVELFAKLLDAWTGDNGDGQPVHAFGELVGALWADGRIEAALQIEDVWCELTERKRVSALCAYPSDVTANATATAVEGVIGRHSATVPTPASPSAGAIAKDLLGARSFPCSVLACRAARRFVAAALADCGTGNTAELAGLLTSELATNAVRHASSPFTVHITSVPAGVRVAVSDRVPSPQPDQLPVTVDHGLGIVASLADRWGVEAHAGGKVVWADLAARPVTGLPVART